MTKYIWITIGVISLILFLAYQQAPNEPEVQRPLDEIVEDIPFEQQEGEPIVSENGNIKITRPQPNTTITSPMLIKGEARVFEGTFQMRLKDAQDNIIVEKFGTAAAEEVGEFGTFGELLLFDDISSETGTLEVYWQSPEDGSEQDLVSIPIKF
jgi:hypothetical protein